MRTSRRLDYAEFQVSPRHTRCQLFVTADGIAEKLASGPIEPFLAHLRGAQVQAAQGNQLIRLEDSSGHNKSFHHQQSDDGWFCKGTVQRFVRFVSTPEVLERVKTIEEEIIQLEQVHSALLNTSGQVQDKLSFNGAGSGCQTMKYCASTLVPKRLSIEENKNESDASKNDLLKAMDARLRALNLEQAAAISRACAAGFDDDSIRDLIIFADHFGADRLRTACGHFLAISHKEGKGDRHAYSPKFETPDDVSCTSNSSLSSMLVSKEEAWLQGAKRKLNFGANKLHTVEFCGGTETNATGKAGQDAGKNGSSTIIPSNQLYDGDRFCAHFEETAQQVEEISSKDFGSQMDEKKELALQECSHKDAGKSSRARCSQRLEPALEKRSTQVPGLKVCVESSGSGHHSARSPERHIAQDYGKASKETNTSRNTDENLHKGTDRGNDQDTQEDVPAGRLSVQAAISLFESKQKDSSEPPIRRLGKRANQKVLTQVCSSPSEKFVLKRWSVQNSCSPAGKITQEDKVASNDVVEKQQEPHSEKVKFDLNDLSSPKQNIHGEPIADDPVGLNAEDSLTNYLQLDSSCHLEEECNSAGIQDMKQVPSPVQKPSYSVSILDTRLDSQNLQSTDHIFPTVQNDPENTYDSDADLAATQVSVSVSLPEQATAEVKAKSEPLVNRTERNHQNMQLKQDCIVNETPEVSNSDEPSFKLSKCKPYGVKLSAHVTPPVYSEHEKMEFRTMGSPQSKQHLRSKSETIKVVEAPVTNSRQIGKNANLGKPSAKQKMNLMKEIPINLLGSVDLHMQALVQMVEQQNTERSFNSVQTAIRRREEQRGRFYDHYSKLRDAKMMGEHPAKKAEREAKLKLMQDTLERRKAEIEKRSVRLTRKKVHEVPATDLEGKRLTLNKGIRSTSAEQVKCFQVLLLQKMTGRFRFLNQKLHLKWQNDLKAAEGYAYEEPSMNTGDNIFHDTNSISRFSTDHLSKNQFSSLRLQTPVGSQSCLSKSLNNSGNSVREAAYSSKSVSKNFATTTSQLSSSSNIIDNLPTKAASSTKDGSRTLVRIGGSARIHPRVTISPSNVDSLMDGSNNSTTPGKAERKEAKRQSSIARKNSASIAVARSLSTDTEILLGSPKLQQDAEMTESKSPQFSRATQEAKRFLRKGQGIGPGVGAGIVKSVLAETPVKPEENTCISRKQDEFFVDFEGARSTSEDLAKSVVAENSCIQDMDNFATPITETLPLENVESESASRPTSRPTENGDEEAPDFERGSASENDTISLENIISCAKIEIGSRVKDSAPQGLRIHVTNRTPKEKTFILSDLLSRKDSDTFDSTAGHVSSSVSFRETLLSPHGHYVSPFPTAAQPYSSMLHRGAISSRFSPSRVDLSPQNPATWNVSRFGKNTQDPESFTRNRHSGVNQKQASILSLPAKEPSKGFKRLLHFGRKNRASEAADHVSVSTTSEGDDDPDEVREFGSHSYDEMMQNHSYDEMMQKTQIQRKGFEHSNIRDQHTMPEQGTGDEYILGVVLNLGRIQDL
ncbi:hypothetical protein KP509_11G092200 [Ceratopteris richardii]|uniref:Uncharacterized protein n=1 Tax=Ceratopteris richardii TaxID=49495 RepID=A0A8T2TXC9_CERRI|nr:hypothetical protein KP509_11G092200 [Ceratopteris richardii]